MLAAVVRGAPAAKTVPVGLWEGRVTATPPKAMPIRGLRGAPTACSSLVKVKLASAANCKRAASSVTWQPYACLGYQPAKCAACMRATAKSGAFGLLKASSVK